MNIDTLVSWLIHSDYFLLAFWLVSLGAVFTATFAKPPVPAEQSERQDTSPAR